MDFEELAERFEQHNAAALERIEDLQAQVNTLTARASRPPLPGEIDGNREAHAALNTGRRGMTAVAYAVALASAVFIVAVVVGAV